MKSLKRNMKGILLCLFEIAAGILLLIDPNGFTAGIITVAGAVMLIVGLVDVLKYFKADAEEAAAGQYLAKGLVIIAAGAFCIFRTQWFLITFPALTVFYGVVVLVTGLGKLQLTMDLVRGRNKKWFLALISAAVSIVCAIVILRNPFQSASALWAFTGITLIAEAILDAVTLITSGRKAKETAEEEII